MRHIVGSIPACAGEPTWIEICNGIETVYPRVCGGTRLWQAWQSAARGLSPRVRGNLALEFNGVAGQGSIPACAGEPSGRWTRILILRVYPRVCGGTRRYFVQRARQNGLSPRVRGNHRFATLGSVECRSIPACAGEPSVRRAATHGSEVYPRVCGGTHRIIVAAEQSEGLSPRVRGNLPPLFGAGRISGSIPACAGEPVSTLAFSRAWQVYPRVCGGTMSNFFDSVFIKGLSPRVRGNLCQCARRPSCARSIPACAGEPREDGQDAQGGKVYPRVCGGTQMRHIVDVSETGLSPRVRGNPSCPCRAETRPRSIPACAGEPRTAPRNRPMLWVLSPRVRGNHYPRLQRHY